MFHLTSTGALPHVLDEGVCEFAALEKRCAFHQTIEVVGDALLADRPGERRDDQVSDLVPSHVPEHHFTRQDHGPGIHFVHVRVLWRRAVRGLSVGRPYRLQLPFSLRRVYGGTAPDASPVSRLHAPEYGQ